ncbi:MAG: hypothetical protein NC094_10795 [Bacteroidales bacterium]|nr:hypothetical protein [Lachnoclostridium sp.]MCM1385006.1 hypothetical protein [Lachnoclostridium sp.]MCM1465894.1 hypothetical protein [Bacteroidales bacterium]
MLLEELEWKLGGRIKSVLIVLLVMLLMWYAGGSAYGAYADGAYTVGHPWKQYLTCYIKCWEMLCLL